MAHHASMVEREDLVTEMDTAELHEEQVVILVTRVELLLTISHLSGALVEGQGLVVAAVVLVQGLQAQIFLER